MVTILIRIYFEFLAFLLDLFYSYILLHLIVNYLTFHYIVFSPSLLNDLIDFMSTVCN